MYEVTVVTLNTKTKITTQRYSTITNTNYIHFVGNDGKKKHIFHCTKMPAALTYAKIKNKLTALYNQK
jgi:hypothetical protein